MSIRMRHTRGHTNNRRSHHALKATSVLKDKETGKLSLPHRIDESTGMYRGRQIFTPRVKRAKNEKVRGPESKLPAENRHADHEHADQKSNKGFTGFIQRSMRPKARSGMGGTSGGK